MMPRELVAEPSTVLDGGPSSYDSSGGTLRVELVHRHLAARIETAQERLRMLEERNPSVDDVLVARFGGTVATAQRSLAAERVDSELRSAALLRVAHERAAKSVADADAEASLLRVIAGWLRQAPLDVARHDQVIDLTDSATADEQESHPLEATAS